MKFTIISLALVGYMFGLLVAVSDVNHELKDVIDNRGAGWTSIEVEPINDNRTVEVVSSADYGNSVEVKPATQYEDCLQCTGNWRNVQNSYYRSGYQFQHANYGY